jgi:hypothetical protein
MGFIKLSSVDDRSVERYSTILRVMYTRIVYGSLTDSPERYYVKDGIRINSLIVVLNGCHMEDPRDHRYAVLSGFSLHGVY